MSVTSETSKFLATFQLARRLRQDLSDAPDEYAAIRNEIKTVESILQDVEDLRSLVQTSNDQDRKLEQAISECSDILDTCGTLVDKYSFVKSPIFGSRGGARRAWKRFRFEYEDVHTTREWLTASIVLLSAVRDDIQTEFKPEYLELHDGNSEQLNATAAQNQRALIADWYASTAFAKQYSDLLSLRHPDTGAWFLLNETYLDWRQGYHRTLLCPGIPGSGKTVMCATVIHNLRQHIRPETNAVVCYFFSNFRRREDQTVEKTLSILIRQLFQEQLLVPQKVSDLYFSHQKRGTTPTVEELRALFLSLAKVHSLVYIVLDALDEYDDANGTRRKLLDELLNLQKLTANTNLMVTTRDLPAITNYLRPYVRLDVHAAREDVERYLDTQITQLPHFVQKRKELQKHIKEQIADVVAGMFILARLHLDSLRDKLTPAAVLRAIDRIRGNPTDALSRAYDDARLRIDQQAPGLRLIAREALTWILYTRRELSIRELQAALAIEEGMSFIDEDIHLIDVDDVVSICAGLITIDSEREVVRLAHLTAQEHLETVGPEWLVEGHDMIARKCLAYLKMNVFKRSPLSWRVNLDALLSTYALADYAASQWGFHVLSPATLETKTAILEYLEDDNSFCLTTQIPFRNHLSVCGIAQIKPLHLAAYFGLGDFIPDLLRSNQAESKDSHGQTPLHWAVRYGRTNFVELLLKHSNINADIEDSDGRPSLSWAAESGHEELVKLLLARSDVELDKVDHLGRTALSWAAKYGRKNVVSLLLQQDIINVNGKDKSGRSPLYWAIASRQSDSAAVLLAHPDIDVDTRDNGRDSPLLLALRFGDRKVVKTLLAHPKVNIHHANRNGWTSISLIMGQERTELLETLVARAKSDLNKPDKCGMTALMWATEHNKTNMAEYLLAQPKIDVNQSGLDDITPLSLAAWKGEAKIVELLLNQPRIDVNTAEWLGETPLWLATLHGETSYYDTRARQRYKITCKMPLLPRRMKQPCLRVMKMLLARPEIQVNCQDGQGMTALSVAARLGWRDAVELLLAHSEIDTSLADNRGDTALIGAQDAGHQDIADLIETRAKADKVSSTVEPSHAMDPTGTLE